MNRFPIILLLCSSIGLFGALSFTAPLAGEAQDHPTATVAATGPTTSHDRSSPPNLDPNDARLDYRRELEALNDHTIGEIAIGLSFALAFIWIFGFELALKLRGDIFPSKVRARLDRLDAARLSAIASAWGLKSRKDESELLDEKQLYEALAAAANAALDKARQDLKLNSVDEEYLIPEIDGLIARAKDLSSRLRTKEPAQASAADRGEASRFIWASINRINRGWERALASGQKLKLITIDQLNALRWPSWSRLEGPLL
ncbi:hypothetical protein RZS28_04810 [Methylocapsa polymorpha]|uniref:Uncharacterized protein n=1 Tax=Methylocapsa polymorpha TaxID=3080828 RepID=A0ABZ0HV01_9HYPH|nr:hypothetical protein RZS28_04810 [Methylocapsa sp. RX1]